MDITQVLNVVKMPNFIPAVSLKSIGKWANLQGAAFDEKWPASVRIGWIRQNNTAADAVTSAYLVGQGVES